MDKIRFIYNFDKNRWPRMYNDFEIVAYKLETIAAYIRIDRFIIDVAIHKPSKYRKTLFAIECEILFKELHIAIAIPFIRFHSSLDFSSHKNKLT